MIKTLYPVFQKWSEKGAVYILSDLHFDDEDCKLMDTNWITPDEQIKIIRQFVHKHDTFICLGDVGNPEYIGQIPGYHVLIMGNHDSSATKYKQYFDEVYTGPLFIAEKILLSHEPIYGLPWCFNIHGHDHNQVHPLDSSHLNLAANVCGYTPVSLAQVIKGGALSNIQSIHRITIDLATERKILRSEE